MQTYEFENLSRSATDTTAIVNNADASNGQWTRLEADAAGDWIEFTLNASAGIYTIDLRGRTGRIRGQYQLSIDGVNQGAVFDQYQSESVYNTWNLGSYSFERDGDYQFRFTTVGRSANSGGFKGSFDSIQLTSSDPLSNRVHLSAYRVMYRSTIHP